MATFTSNYWVTGETITADKLNGNWGGLVTFNGDEGFPEEGINIGTGLSVGELMNLRFCEIATEEDSQDNTFMTYNYHQINYIGYIPDMNKYILQLKLSDMNDTLMYDPITGILSKFSSERL